MTAEAVIDLLLVEDNPADAAYIGELLTDLRVPPRVHTATSLAEASILLGQTSADLVLLDLRLPDGSGVACVEAVRARAPDAPIIVLTGMYEDEPLALACLNAGAQDYLSKAEISGSGLGRAIAYARARASERAARAQADELHARLATIVESSPDAIFSCRPDTTITTWNSGADQLFGVDAEHALGRPVDALLSLPGLDLGRAEAGSREVEVALPDRGLATLSVVKSRLAPGPSARRGFAVVVRDVTEARRKDAELRERNAQLEARDAQMRALTAHLNEVRELERARISREVHDELGQLLTGLGLDLDWLHRRVAELPASEATARLDERLTTTKALADQTARTVQRIALELRPSALDRLGLTAAVRDEARRLARHTGLEVTLEAEEVHPPPEVATELFRILQEMLTNVVRHARATHVVISLRALDGAWRLEVEDDGVGLPAGVRPGLGSLGLLGMQERAAAHGGRIEVIRAAPDRGTRATVHVPRHEGPPDEDDPDRR